MKLTRTLRPRKDILIALTLLIMTAFIYGCQCEGSIGNSSKNKDNIEIINTRAQAK